MKYLDGRLDVDLDVSGDTGSAHVLHSTETTRERYQSRNHVGKYRKEEGGRVSKEHALIV